MDYDTRGLVKLGKRRAWLKAETQKNLDEIGVEIAAARRAGITQEKIAAFTGLSRVTVAKYEPTGKEPEPTTD
jgi:DNA-binding XRE family transcriptional regulator